MTSGPVTSASVTCGLILAAGAGSRFDGGVKLLADLDGRPLVQHAITAMCAVPALARVVVVLGARADDVLAAIELGRADAVVCEQWSTGMSASLRTGIAALGTAVTRVIVTLGDGPTVSPAVIERLLAAPVPARATYDGRPGHPVVLGPAQLAGVPALRGDAGARTLLDGAATIECGDIASGADVDTVADLASVTSRHRGTTTT